MKSYQFIIPLFIGCLVVFFVLLGGMDIYQDMDGGE